MQLIVMHRITGINIKFCKNIVVKKNSIPFCTPKDAIIAETEYPMQNPLKSTIPKTIGIPTTVEPKSQSRIVAMSFCEPRS